MFDGVLGPPASKPEAMDPGAGYAISEWWHLSEVMRYITLKGLLSYQDYA